MEDKEKVENKEMSDSELWAQLYQKLLCWQTEGYDINPWLNLIKTWDIYKDHDKIIALAVTIDATLEQKMELIMEAEAEAERQLQEEQKQNNDIDFQEILEERYQNWELKRKSNG